MATRYIVFQQVADTEFHRVEKIWGPFTTYQQAREFSAHANSVVKGKWFGVLTLQKPESFREQTV